MFPLQGPGPYNVDWTRKDGQPLPNRAYITQDYSLVIRDAIPEDSGIYVITVVNPIGTTTDEVEITVMGKFGSQEFQNGYLGYGFPCVLVDPTSATMDEVWSPLWVSWSSRNSRMGCTLGIWVCSGQPIGTTKDEVEITVMGMDKLVFQEFWVWIPLIAFWINPTNSGPQLLGWRVKRSCRAQKSRCEVLLLGEHRVPTQTTVPTWEGLRKGNTPQMLESQQSRLRLSGSQICGQFLGRCAARCVFQNCFCPLTDKMKY